MTRNRSAERSEIIYSFLKEHLNELFTRAAMLKATGLKNGRTTDAALKRVIQLAADDGYCLVYPLYDNGYCYSVTDDARAAIDPKIHLAQTSHGLGVRQDLIDDFIRDREGQLPAVERAVFQALGEMDEQDRQSRKARAAVLAAVAAVHRGGKSS